MITLKTVSDDAPLSSILVALLFKNISAVLLFGKQIYYKCRSICFPQVTDYHNSLRPVVKKVIGSFPESFPALS